MFRVVTSTAPLIRRSQYFITYSRQYFEDLNIDRQGLQRQRKQQQILKLKQDIKAIPSNDSNPSNLIKNLKIDHPLFTHIENQIKKQQTHQCAIICPQPRKPPTIFSVNNRYIITTLKKATLAMKIIRKKYLFDAILALQGSQKKVCKMMKSTLDKAVRHAANRGLDPFRLFVHGFVVGRKMRFRGIRYHAKSKSGREFKTVCQIRVIIQQRNDKQFWEQVGTGNAPAGFANIIRDRLLKTNVGYQKLIQFGGVTTAKGRQQKRQILKRRAYRIMKQNQKKQTFVPKKQIQKELRQEQGKKIKQIFEALKSSQQISSIKRREALFKKNMGVQS